VVSDLGGRDLVALTYVLYFMLFFFFSLFFFNLVQAGLWIRWILILIPLVFSQHYIYIIYVCTPTYIPNTTYRVDKSGP
jgi:hypothetical protein